MDENTTGQTALGEAGDYRHEWELKEKAKCDRWNAAAEKYESLGSNRNQERKSRNELFDDRDSFDPDSEAWVFRYVFLDGRDDPAWKLLNNSGERIILFEITVGAVGTNPSTRQVYYVDHFDLCKEVRVLSESGEEVQERIKIHKVRPIELVVLAYEFAGLRGTDLIRMIEEGLNEIADRVLDQK